MTPKKVKIGDIDYRLYEENGEHYAAERVPKYALRRVFNLAVNNAKTVDFSDLTGFWEIKSLFISSPEDSEVLFEILYDNVPFFSDTMVRHELPKQVPTVLVNSNITVRVTAKRNYIGLLLIYLKPAYLAHNKDF